MLMRRRLLRWTMVLSSLVVLGAGGLFAPRVEAASTEPAASCLPINSNGYNSVVGHGQELEETFTPTISGTMSSAELALQVIKGETSTGSVISPNPLTVALTTTKGGQPGTVLATTSIAVSAVTKSLTTVAFSSSPRLIAGDTYALVLSTTAVRNSGINAPYYVAFLAENACAGDMTSILGAGSTTFTNLSNASLAFQVNVLGAPVTGVTLNPRTLSLTVGGRTGTLQATVSPTDATNPAVTWSSSNTAVATVSTAGVVTPVAAGTATITATTTDGGYTASSAVTVAAATVPVTPFVPPSMVPEPVILGGHTSQVIGNMGLNTPSAIQNGTYVGYREERAAIEAGATFTGEGTNSSYLSAILDGSGVGRQRHVPAVQQGQFAALYQKLGIIPTWINNTVSIPQGVTALAKAGAPTLAIENYLVQLDGFSWAAAQTQAAAGFPIQSGG